MLSTANQFHKLYIIYLLRSDLASTSSYQSGPVVIIEEDRSLRIMPRLPFRYVGADLVLFSERVPFSFCRHADNTYTLHIRLEDGCGLERWVVDPEAPDAVICIRGIRFSEPEKCKKDNLKLLP